VRVAAAPAAAVTSVKTTQNLARQPRAGRSPLVLLTASVRFAADVRESRVASRLAQRRKSNFGHDGWLAWSPGSLVLHSTHKYAPHLHVKKLHPVARSTITLHAGHSI
jgi:hypothetical protein